MGAEIRVESARFAIEKPAIRTYRVLVFYQAYTSLLDTEFLTLEDAELSASGFTIAEGLKTAVCEVLCYVEPRP